MPHLSSDDFGDRFSIIKSQQDLINKGLFGGLPEEELFKSKHHEIVKVTRDGKTFFQNRLVGSDSENELKQKRVSHEKFGEGTVLSDDGEKMTINFDSHGEKMLLTKYAKLTDVNTGVLVNKEVKKEPELENKKAVFKKEEKPVKEKKSQEGVKVEGVKIVAQSEKAFRISKDGRETWIPKGWVKDLKDDDVQSFKSNFSKRANEALDSAKEKSKPVLTDKFKINKETGKAYLVGLKIKDPISGVDKDIEEWFPKSKASKNEDGKISLDADFLHTKEEEINEKYSAISASVKPSVETDKAIGYNISVYENLSEQTVKRTLWFPKTQVKEQENGTHIIPKWLFDKRVDELYDSVKQGGWQHSSNSTFELEGIENFTRKNPEIIKAEEIIDISKAFESLGITG